MKNLRTTAIERINSYITYAENTDCDIQMDRELYYSACGKIHLAFDLELITKDEKRALLSEAANRILGK